MQRKRMQIELPDLYPLQREIIDDPHPRKMGVAGRRSGKTTLAGSASVETFLASQKVLFTSPSQNQCDTVWDKIKWWLSPLWSAYDIKNEGRRVIDGQPIGLGRIRVKTGSNPDILRGDDADLIIVDEAAFLYEWAWTTVLSPMLADRGGTAMLLSTPRRKNWFYQLYARIMSGELPAWRAWHFTSFNNPYLSPEALELLAQDMSEDEYRQEILAEFIETDGSVFRNVQALATMKKMDPYAGSFSAGLDFGTVNDYTVLTIMDKTSMQVVDWWRIRRQSWSYILGGVKEMCDNWKIDTLLAEINSVGSPNIETLRQWGVPVQPFITSAQSKPPLIQRLALALEMMAIRLPADEAFIHEFEAFEAVVNASGYIQYRAPQGMHDDTIMSVALAYEAAKQISWVKRYLPIRVKIGF